MIINKMTELNIYHYRNNLITAAAQTMAEQMKIANRFMHLTHVDPGVLSVSSPDEVSPKVQTRIDFIVANQTRLGIESTELFNEYDPNDDRANWL